MHKPAPIQYFFPGHLKIPKEFRERLSAGNKASNAAATSGKKSKRGTLACRVGVIQPGSDLYRWDSFVSPEGVEYKIGAFKTINCLDLLRDGQRIPSQLVELANGGEWLVPVINPMVATCKLPVREVIDPSGQWIKLIEDEYLAISEEAAALSTEFQCCVFEGRKFRLDGPDVGYDLRDFCCRVLALNYDVTPRELSVMRVFNEAIWQRIIEAVIDWTETFRCMQELIEEVGTANNPLCEIGDTINSPDGEWALVLSTIRHAQTCT